MVSELFQNYMVAENFHVKYARGVPSFSGKEFHQYSEIVLFLDGEAQLISKNIQIKLEPNNLIFIPKEHFHQFVMTEPEKYTRCILGFEDTPETKALIDQTMTDICVFPTPSETMLAVFKNIMAASQAELSKNEQHLFLNAAVVQLLIEQKISSKKPISKYVTISETTQKALALIDKNYFKELTLSDISKQINVSVSLLSHCFKKDLNISVYRYVSEKRLSMVRQYVKSGTPLNTAATMCGFKDYSAFFRLYKAHYGESPSSTKKS